MKIVINEKMKEWVAAYIRSHRKEGCISIHCVFTKFNEDFRAQFGIDPVAAVSLMEKEGFLKGNRAQNGYSIWLAEDAGKGQKRGGGPWKKSDVQTESATNDGIKQLAVSLPEAKYAFEKLPHPETGVVDILGLFQHIMYVFQTRLDGQRKMDGGYIVANFKLVENLQLAGVPRGQCPEISRLLQEMALIKRYGEGKTGSVSMWGVLHAKAVPYFITPANYVVARRELLFRASRNKELSELRKFKAEAEAAKSAGETAAPLLLPAPVVESAPDTIFENIAEEALLELDRLKKALVAARADFDKERSALTEVIAERDALAAKLAESAVVSPAEAKRAAMAELLAKMKENT